MMFVYFRHTLLIKRGMLFFLVTSINLISGQGNSGYVVYDWFQNMGLPYHSKSILYFNEYESAFKELEDSSVKKITADSIKTANFKYEADLATYTNLKTQKIISQELVFTKAYIVYEDLPKIKWDFINEFQKLGKYNCQKAVGSFRGRTYEVWFTSELPINFGPWKLNGLPGLILKVTESNGKILFEAERILINDSSQKNKIIENIKIPDVGKKVTLKEFVTLKDNEADDLLKFIISKQDRSYSSDILKVEKAGRDFNYEISYEWEQTTYTEKKQ